MRRAAAAALAVFALAGTAAWGQQMPTEPSSYRMSDYRGPTPATLAGARVVDTAGADALWKAGAAFVDVLPHAPRPSNLPAGTIWRDKPRMDIPGSIWLPDTGYGALAPVTEKYLRDGLATVTGGDRARLLIFYCMKNCWMSWNAAKRALSIGYKNVAWYPDGTDGWQVAKLPLRQARPAPAQPE